MRNKKPQAKPKKTAAKPEKAATEKKGKKKPTPPATETNDETPPGYHGVRRDA